MFVLANRYETTNETELPTASQNALGWKLLVLDCAVKKVYSGGKHLALGRDRASRSETTDETELSTASQSALGWKL